MTLQLQWQFDEAARIYQSILANKPDFEECLINLVTIGMARKDQAMIADYSEKLLTLRPNSQTALEGLATCAFASGDYEAALRYCSKLIEYTPESFDRWFNLGVAQQKTGKPGAGRQGLFRSGSHPPGRQPGLCESGRHPSGIRRARRSAHGL